MFFRAVGNRCAVDLNDFASIKSIEPILTTLQFGAGIDTRVVDVDILKLARDCCGTAVYRRGARLQAAPHEFDCSSFTKWLYAQRGIWLPRRSIQQSQIGEEVSITELELGDLLFTSGRQDYYFEDPASGIGHVAMASSQGSVIHAANAKAGIVESRLADFLADTELRTIKRIVPQKSNVVTLEIPLQYEIESSDDVYWKLVVHCAAMVDNYRWGLWYGM